MEFAPRAHSAPHRHRRQRAPLTSHWVILPGRSLGVAPIPWGLSLATRRRSGASLRCSRDPQNHDLAPPCRHRRWCDSRSNLHRLAPRRGTGTSWHVALERRVTAGSRCIPRSARHRRPEDGQWPFALTRHRATGPAGPRRRAYRATAKHSTGRTERRAPGELCRRNRARTPGASGRPCGSAFCTLRGMTTGVSRIDLARISQARPWRTGTCDCPAWTAANTARSLRRLTVPAWRRFDRRF